MAGASLFLPFLPLLPKQILLNNFLSDVPSMTIATDTVDREQLDGPRGWDIRFIRNFILVFGLVSSVFDYLTCGALLHWLRATEQEFQTGWFIESLMTHLFIVLGDPHPGAVLPEPAWQTAARLDASRGGHDGVVLPTIYLGPPGRSIAG